MACEAPTPWICWAMDIPKSSGYAATVAILGTCLGFCAGRWVARNEMPQVSLVAVRPVESTFICSSTFSPRHLCFPNIRTDWWLWSYALHDFASRWSSLKDGLQQSSWKVSQTLMKRVKHVVALRASLAMWQNSELACLNHSVCSVASGPSKLHTTMFPQHALRMTSCHAGSLQCWFETQLWNSSETY